VADLVTLLVLHFSHYTASYLDKQQKRLVFIFRTRLLLFLDFRKWSVNFRLIHVYMIYKQ